MYKQKANIYLCIFETITQNSTSSFGLDLQLMDIVVFDVDIEAVLLQ